MASTYLAIDPGNDTGWAEFDAAGVLVRASLGYDFPTNVRAAVIERPQIYRAAKSKGDPNDLITLAIRVGRYSERLERAGVKVEHVLPTTWKGQIDKGRHHARIERALSPLERTRMSAFPRTLNGLSVAGNVWDAVGLGRWAFDSHRFARQSPA